MNRYPALLNQLHIHQTQAFRNSVVYAVYGAVQIGMGSVDVYVVLNGHPYATLYHIGIRKHFQAAEQQRMMRHNKVAPQLYGLLNHFFGHVKAQ